MKMRGLAHFIGGTRVKGQSGRFAEGFKQMAGAAISLAPLASRAEFRAAFGSAGERCMAISVAAPVGVETANELVKRHTPRVESLRIGPSIDEAADFGPPVTREHLQK